MMIRRGWTRQVAATALLVVGCGAVATVVVAFGAGATAPGVAGKAPSTATLVLSGADLAPKR